MIDVIHKRFIKDDIIHLFQAILLIMIIFDIKLTIFWLSSEKNIIVDAASWFDYKKLTNLEFQNQLYSLRHFSLSHRMMILRQKLYFFYNTHWQYQYDETTNQFRNHTSDIISFTIIINFQSSSNLSFTDSSKSYTISNL